MDSSPFLGLKEKNILLTMFYAKVIKICPNYAKIIELFQLMPSL
jgi:hypothetical protein